LCEQDLLGQVIEYLASQPEIRHDHPLNVSKCPIPLRISSIDERRSLSEFWTAIGNKVRPSFVLNATIALEPPFEKQERPATSSLLVKVGPIDASDSQHIVPSSSGEPLYLFGGKVSLTKPADRDKVVQIKVRIKELGRETSTDLDGLYQFRDVPASGRKPYTLVAEIYEFDKVQNKLVLRPSSPQSKSVYVPRSEKTQENYDLTL
jgi:hypothetical protein